MLIGFQSTPPVWVVTLSALSDTQPLVVFQSTPPVWVVTGSVNYYKDELLFQSTPPVWVVTSTINDMYHELCISIHTTRVGGDSRDIVLSPCIYKISIHTTRVGGDRVISVSLYLINQFQSTPPVWVVTKR